MRRGSSGGFAVTGLTLVVWLAGAGPARAQLGGMASDGNPAMGGFGGAGSGNNLPQVQLLPTRLRTPHPLSAPAARTWLKLQQAVDIPFADEVPLEQVVQFVEESTRDKAKPGQEAKGGGVPVYVDPVALQEAEKTLGSPVAMRLKGVPLASALTLMLKQLGLAYYVQEDGILVIGSQSSSDSPREQATPVRAPAARTWLKLHEPLKMQFPDEAPLSDVLNYIKAATKAKEFPSGLLIYVDLGGGGDRTIQAPVRLDLDGVPLATSLDLLTRQLEMTYRVQDDGIVVIEGKDEAAEEEEALPSGHGIETLTRLRFELEEARLKAQIAEQRARAASFERGMGMMGGGMGPVGPGPGGSGMMSRPPAGERNPR